MTKSFKSFLILVITICATVLSSCDGDTLADLQSQIDGIKSNQIAAIDAQIASINASITALETTDTELRGYISSLQEQQTLLAQEDSRLAEAIEAVRKDLQDSITTVQAAMLAELESHRQNVASQLDLISASIATLIEKDTELAAQIASLREYTDGEIQKTKDWASATFVTLTKYNETVALVATIQEQIATINTRMDEFQTSLNGLATQLNGLSTDLQQAITDNAAALAQVASNITTAYTEAIATAISVSESSLKNWVAAELTAYYTAVQIDAKLETLQAEQDQKLNQQKTYVETLLTNLQTVLEGKINANAELINGLQGQINNLSAEAAQLAKRILNNADSIAANSTKINENAQAIAQNSLDIAACELLIAANKTLIQDNARAIAANDTAILALQASVDLNEQGISNNVANIAKNASDIAVNAGLIAANATAISNNTTAIAENAEAIVQLRTDLQAAIADLTESYNSVIQTAITTLDGKLTGEIATQISTVNARIDTEVATINAAISALTTRVEACESDIAAIRSDIAAIQADIEALQSTVADLLARIQSISYVPKYSDGKAVMTYTNYGELVPGYAVLTFKVQPQKAAAALAEIWQTAMKVEAVSAETRIAPDVTNLSIQGVTADKGYLTVVVSGTGLTADFFNGAKSAFIALAVSDGNNERTSEYVPIIPEVAISVEDAKDLTPVSATLSGQLGRETAGRRTEKVAVYYSTTETTIAGLVENGTKEELIPVANGSFSIFLQQLTPDVSYNYVVAVKDCGKWFYTSIKTIYTLNYTAEAVDMGLPSGLKWASYNLGAASPEQSGAYFAWGETEPKADYSWGTYKWGKRNNKLTKYCNNPEYGVIDNKTVLDAEDDAAAVRLEGYWRMPTYEEWQELFNYSERSKTIQQETNGWLITSTINGNSFFLPESGSYDGTKIRANYTYYWASNLSDYDWAVGAGGAGGDLNYGYNVTRCLGCSVRPVHDWDWNNIDVTITTRNVTEIGQHAACLNGTLDVVSDQNPPKSVWFLIKEGTMTLDALISSGTRKDVGLQLDGSFSWNTAANNDIALNADTKYSYVACAKIGTRTFYGEVCSFTTNPYTFTAEAVDMGLSVMWSSVNLGASLPEEDGAFFAWGETVPKHSYSENNYKWGDASSNLMMKYCTNASYGTVDNLIELELADDAAWVNLDGDWRLPTDSEWTELRSSKNCSWIWTTVNGIKGGLVTSKINGNSIFLPAAGCRFGNYHLENQNPSGCYWSSSLDTNHDTYALEINFYYLSAIWKNSNSRIRYYGNSVRPVQDLDWSQITVSLIEEDATEIDWYSACLNGRLSVEGNTNLHPAAWFLYSETENSLDELITNGTKLPASLTNTAFSAGVSDLKPETTYYYVACARVGDKVFYGTEVQSFTTTPNSGFAASVNGVEYLSFSSAIEVVNSLYISENDNITLVLGRDLKYIHSFSLNNPYRPIVFDLNGHTLSSQDSVLITVENATVNFTDNGLTKGKITTIWQKALVLKANANVSIDNCTIESTKAKGSSFSEMCVYVNNSTASLTINSGTRIQTTDSLTCIRVYSGTLTVNDGEITSGINTPGWYSLVLAGTGSATINGGSFYTSGTNYSSTCHIAASGARATINGGYFYSNGRVASVASAAYVSNMVLNGGIFNKERSNTNISIGEGHEMTTLELEATHFHETIGQTLSYSYQVK